ncbi:hypothetical protein ACFX15_027305 [Malus domestica]
MQEEEETPENGSRGSGGSHTHLWWAGASAAQLGWAVMSSRKGCAGNSFTMPFKAFAVASLYVGSVATAGIAGLHASGIREVEDLVELGANIRTGLGVPRRRSREE